MIHDSLMRAPYHHLLYGVLHDQSCLELCFSLALNYHITIVTHIYDSQRKPPFLQVFRSRSNTQNYNKQVSNVFTYTIVEQKWFDMDRHLNCI